MEDKKLLNWQWGDKFSWKFKNSYGKLSNIFQKDNSGYYAKCVFHNDKTPSLRIKEIGGKAIYHCFGCEATGYY